MLINWGSPFSLINPFMALMDREDWDEAIGTWKFSNQSVYNWCCHDWRKWISGAMLFLHRAFGNTIETAPSAIGPGHLAWTIQHPHKSNQRFIAKDNLEPKPLIMFCLCKSNLKISFVSSCARFFWRLVGVAAWSLMWFCTGPSDGYRSKEWPYL